MCPFVLLEFCNPVHEGQSERTGSLARLLPPTLTLSTGALGSLESRSHVGPQKPRPQRGWWFPQIR